MPLFFSHCSGKLMLLAASACAVALRACHHLSSHQLAGLFSGAEIVDNFTISGNSLGDQEWSGYIPVTTTATNGSIVNTGAYGYNNGSW